MAGVVWYRKDLRVDDHEALMRACNEQNTVRAVFIQQESGDRGKQQVRFEQETLQSLREHLEQLGVELTILQGETVEQLTSFVQPEDIVYFHRMTGEYERRQENAVRKTFYHANV